MENKFSGHLAKDLMRMRDGLHMDVNMDVNLREFSFLHFSAAIFYLDGMVSSNMLQAYVIKPCLEAKLLMPMAGTALDLLTKKVLISSSFEIERDIKKSIQALMNGQVVLLCDTMAEAILVDIREFAKRPVGTPLTESVVVGQQQGFNESIRDNITLIRRIVHSADLINEMTTVGRNVPTALSILYLKGIASEAALERLKGRIRQIDLDCVLSLGILQQLIEDHPLAFLPQAVTTERPDRVASFLMEGQIVLVMDGSPMALALPINFFHLMHTSDDTNMRWQYGTFIRLIRLIGICTMLYLPSVFVALTMYHLEALPLPLIDSIIESQSAVPLSLFMETLLMLIMFNLINEAGTRVPGILGSSLSIVSGLILGQAAVEAKLISPLLIIVVASAGLGSHAIPDYSVSTAFRILQLAFLLAAALGGFFGLSLLTVFFVCGLCGMTSLGVPYLAPLSPKRSRNLDLLLRLPIFHQRYRTYLADEAAPARSRGRMRMWEGRN
jgi:Bacillus/Clostridium GerA spore germination protein.